MNKPAGVARVTVSFGGRVVFRDAVTLPDDKVLTQLRVPLRVPLGVGRRDAEVLIEFDPAVRPE